jgi:hypothetical protein
MLRKILIATTTLCLLTVGLALALPAQAGAVCANNAPNAPPDCTVELKGYGGWGACTHTGDDACVYFHQSGELCAYFDGDVCTGVFLPAGACVNNAPNAPADCVVELKGYGSWGLCTHTGDDTCAYIDPFGRACAYEDADLACVPLL